MTYNTAGTWVSDPYIEKLQAEKKSANELQLRKHEDWNDNYELYKNKVRTNRLTQRQAVNIPLMKETVKTLLSRIDDPPTVDWQELSGDEEKELVYQEIWDDQARQNKLELVDVLDKKNVLLYGLGTKKLNIDKKGVPIDALDVFDVVFDPLMEPGKVDTARFIVHQNIFRSIREILADERYTTAGKKDLKIWADSSPGITQANHNKEAFEEKMKRLEAVGVNDKDFPLYAGGDRLINLTEHYTTMWNVGKKGWEKRVAVYADDTVLLLDETLDDLLGVDFWPFVVWAEDPETSDIYPDAVADLVRTPNKVMNVWFSQLIENRTLKNFQMHWFLPGQSYTPQTYQPGPGVMLPAPPGDDINKVIKPVEVSGLDDTFDAIGALTNIVERGSGATALEKGTPEQGTQTLGEIQILVGKANERTVGMAKFYRLAWYELAWKWDKLMHANAPKVIELYKKGRSGKLYPKRIFKNDWMSDAGYEPVITSSSEQETETLKGVQKWQFVIGQNPNNAELRKIALKRELELLDLTPEELRAVVDEEERMQTMQASQQAPQQMQPTPDQAGMAQDIQQQLGQLNAA